MPRPKSPATTTAGAPNGASGRSRRAAVKSAAIHPNNHSPSGLGSGVFNVVVSKPGTRTPEPKRVEVDERVNINGGAQQLGTLCPSLKRVSSSTLIESENRVSTRA